MDKFLIFNFKFLINSQWFKYLNISNSFQISNFKLKIRPILVILSFFYLLIPTTVFADGVSLSVSPPLLNIEAIPPTDARAPLIIQNNSDKPVELKVLLTPFKPTGENGAITYLGVNDKLTGADQAIFDKIRVVDDGQATDTIELGPKQKKKLELQVLLPKKEPLSDYYFSVVFLSSAQRPTPGDKDSLEGNNVSETAAGIATNVLLSVGKRNQAKGYIDEFSAPSYVESGPVPFSLRVHNSGTQLFAPKGVIIIKNMFGQAIGRVDVGPMNVLSNTTRAMIDTEQIKNASISGQITDPKVIWNEKFLLGFYTADLSLALSDEGPIYTKTLHFLAFPLSLLLGILLAAVIVVIVYLRVKQKLKEG